MIPALVPPQIRWLAARVQGCHFAKQIYPPPLSSSHRLGSSRCPSPRRFAIPASDAFTKASCSARSRSKVRQCIPLGCSLQGSLSQLSTQAAAESYRPAVPLDQHPFHAGTGSSACDSADRHTRCPRNLYSASRLHTLHKGTSETKKALNRLRRGSSTFHCFPWFSLLKTSEGL